MNKSRRKFLVKSGCALGMGALATQMRHFGLVSALAQRAHKNDDVLQGGASYKALVVLYMTGGNDGNNTVIPNHNSLSISNYAAYSNARSAQGLSVPRASLLPISVPRMGGLTYGLHPSLGPVSGGVNNGIHELWAQGKMAIVTNVGSLVRPMTKIQFQNGTVEQPYQLFSHSDQTDIAQSGIANARVPHGWGGRIADRMTAGSNPSGLIPMITSTSTADLFTAGQTTLPMSIGDANTPLTEVLTFYGFEGTDGMARKNAFNQIRNYDLSSNYIAAASHITDLSVQASVALSSPAQEVTVTFPDTSTGRRLKQIGRLTKKRFDLNVNRQIFYVEIGNFDTHSGQLQDHHPLLEEVSQAVRAFYDEMAVQGIQNDVTLFTLSEFGRTFAPAGAGANVGSDHAWANHMFVIGGSVLGGDFYGVNTTNGTPFPTLTNGGPDDTESGTGSRGRWIPTTSVDQYAATLARWFGLPQANQSAVFPNIGNFTSTNLGFLP